MEKHTYHQNNKENIEAKQSVTSKKHNKSLEV